MSYTLAYTLAIVSVVVGVVALGAAVWALVEAIRDLAAVRLARIGNGRRLVAIYALRAETARFVAIVLLISAIGVLVLGEQINEGAGPPDGHRVPVTTGIFVVTYAAGLAILAFDGILELRARRRLDAELAGRTTAAEDAAAAATVTDDEEEHRGL